MDRDREDDDELDDGGGRAALVIGFGEKESGSELPTLMRALGRALRAGEWERAAEVFEEAVTVCDDQAHEGQGDDDKPHKSYGGREKNGDREDDLVF